MPRVSLILAGAVSLGSFEAGVLDELLYVLDGLNRDGGRDVDDPYRIDGIAGASAGAMSGALVAQAVTRGLAKRQLLHDAWVQQIDITRLLDRIPPNALLSKAAIAEIGAAFLPYPGDGAPSSLAADTLRLAFTVSNMTGVDYHLAASSDPGSGKTFGSTFHAERREFVLRRDRPGDDPWGDIREAAIASGNFPLAFAAHRLPAVEASWPSHGLSTFPEAFWYVDGGMFNNEPVGEAARLARKTDDPESEARIDPGRLFILVDPNLNRPHHDAEFSDQATLFATGKRVAAAVMGEATANDWLRALRRNNEVGWRDRMVKTMADLVRTISVAEPEDFLRQLESAGDEVVARKREVLGAARYPAGYRNDAVDRLMEQFGEHAGDMGETRRRIFGNLIFLLNSVAGLDRKQQLNLSMIHTDGSEVAGDQLHSFAGFFHRDWRQHDYTVGRAKARAALPGILKLEPDRLPEREPGVPYEPEVDLRGVTMSNAPRSSRERLRDATMLKVRDATRDLQVGPRGLRWMLGPVVRSAVRKAAKSRIEAALEL